MLARRRASFISDWRSHSRALTSREIAQVLEAAERLEVRRKGEGRVNGPITRIGLILLRALATRFLNRKSGLRYPSYTAMQEATGLCRQSVAVAIACLERAGVLTVTRRLRRQQVERVNDITGLHESYSGVVQDTSLYILSPPGAWAEHLPVPNGRRAPFPAPRQLALLRTGRLTWRVQPSLSDREKPPHRLTQPGARPLSEAIDALRASVERATRAGFQGRSGAL